MKYSAVFWDNDGTLVDTETFFFQSCVTAFAVFGIPCTEEFFEKELVGGKLSLKHWLAEEHHLTQEQIQQLRVHRDQIYSDLLTSEAIRIYDGIPEVLELLQSQNTPMAIVTSAHRNHLETIHQQTGFLEKYFSFAVCEEDVPHVKPAPDPYLMAAEKLGVDPTQSLAIEDTPHGCQAAKKAGMTVVAIPNKHTHKRDFPHADHVLKSARELKDLLRK